MSSSIFFRFKSQKSPLPITFDGTSLSVFEVKREIIAISKLGDGTDFDLEIMAPEDNKVYDDDTTQIPRSTTVIARRLPASKPGAGRAARYVTGKMPVTAKNQHRIESTPAATAKTNTPAANGTSIGSKDMSEEEQLNAMLGMQDEAWKQDQAANAGKPIIRSTFNKHSLVPDKPLPPGYTCHRCGEKGHWIQACPTNNDPNFDNRPKFRRTTGIPRSMLKKIDKPVEVGEDGKIDVSKLPPGVMYTANGEWVVAAPDTATWEKYQEQHKASAEKAKEASADVEELRKRHLLCSIDERPFDHPAKTPCCGMTYCQNCIETILLDNDFVCPNCGEQALLDDLKEDKETEDKLTQYHEEKAAEKAAKEQEAHKSPAADASPKVESPKEAKSPASTSPDVNTNGTVSESSTPNLRKRSADEELENNRKPGNPAETKKEGTKPATPIPTGPKSEQQKNNMKIANNMQDFALQMQAMASSMPNMPPDMPAMMNPMAGFNPMMGMGMMPGFNPMMMPGYGMNGMNGMNGVNGGMGGFGGMPNMDGSAGWQGPQQGWGARNGMMMQSGGAAGGDGGAYFRQPVNPHRQQGRQRRQRSADYKQMGS